MRLVFQEIDVYISDNLCFEQESKLEHVNQTTMSIRGPWGTHFHVNRARTHSSVPSHLTVWCSSESWVCGYNVRRALARMMLFACLHDLGHNLQPLMQDLPLSGYCTLVVGGSLLTRDAGSFPVIWKIDVDLVIFDVGREVMDQIFCIQFRAVHRGLG